MSDRTRFIYVRDARRNPVGLVAYRTMNGEIGCRIEYAVSCHNPADRFDRAIARQVAEGRLTRAPMSAEGAFHAQALRTVFEQLAAYPSVPTRVRAELARHLRETSPPHPPVPRFEPGDRVRSTMEGQPLTATVVRQFGHGGVVIQADEGEHAGRDWQWSPYDLERIA